MNEAVERQNRIYRRVRGIHTGNHFEYVEELEKIFISEGYKRVPELKGLSDEEMEKHKTFGLYLTSIPMLHVEAISQATVSKIEKDIEEANR